jgi:Spy/CpxP family protein refolding chaperone
MKSMLRIAVIAAGLAVAALPAARAADDTPPAPGGQNTPGQTTRPERRGPRMDPAERLQRLSEVLNLTDDQKAKIASILKDDQEKGQAIRNDSSLSREDRRAKMMDLMKDSQAQIRALLTPEQQQKFDAMPRPARGPRDGGAGNGPPPAENGPPPSTP